MRRRFRPLRHATVLLLLTGAGPLAAQAPTPVTAGAVVQRRLAAGGSDEFVLRVTSPSFVVGDADQHSVDVVVEARDSGGRVVERVDGPSRGPERFAFAAERPGTYRIRVRAFAADSGGSYTLHLARVERLAATPAGRVDQLMELYDPDGPGAAIGVLRGGRLVFEKGYGRASLEYPLPITPHTVFHVASVSKQFTAMGIVLLAQQGRLSLDDDIRKYIPELPDYGKTITLRNLLTHTSGIRDQWDLWALSGGRMDDVITTEDLFRLVVHQRALNFPPGKEYLYSNSGFMLLARVVERVGGIPFSAWMQRNVFAPLHMAHTRVHDDVQRIVPGRAYSYENAPGGGYEKSVLSYSNDGATSLFTTVEDMARWLENFHTGALGGAAAREQLLTRGILTSGDTLPYALGIGVDRYRGQRRLSHSGADAGFRSYVAFFPDLDAGVIVFSNLASFDPARVASNVADAFLGDALGPREPPRPERATAAAPDSARADTSGLAGRYYSSEVEAAYDILLRGDSVVVHRRHYPDQALKPRGRDTFAGSWPLVTVKVQRDAATGRVTGLLVTSGRVRDLRFVRQDEVAAP